MTGESAPDGKGMTWSCKFDDVEVDLVGGNRSHVAGRGPTPGKALEDYVRQLEHTKLMRCHNTWPPREVIRVGKDWDLREESF